MFFLGGEGLKRCSFLSPKFERFSSYHFFPGGSELTRCSSGGFWWENSEAKAPCPPIKVARLRDLALVSIDDAEDPPFDASERICSAAKERLTKRVSVGFGFTGKRAGGVQNSLRPTVSC